MKSLSFNLVVSTLLLSSAYLPMNAGTTWTLGSSTYNVDTLYHATIGPGITRTSLALSGAAKERIFYTTVDLTNEFSDMRVTTANDNASGYATLSSVCNRKTEPGKKYIAGVNADFFSGSQALGSIVVDGRPVLTSTAQRPSWFITDKRQMSIGVVNLRATATCNGKSHKLSAFNGGRNSGSLVLFTDAYGKSYQTNGLGLEVAVMPIEGAPAFRGSLKVRVVSYPSGNTVPLSETQWALSGNTGTPVEFLQDLKPGDEIEFTFNSSLGVEGNIQNLAGGYPIMINDNTLIPIYSSAGYEHVVENHPRTCIGFNEDYTKAIILVCDGRSTISSGMTVANLARVMKQLGCTEALNYDGGGSSEMYTYDFGVINRPSDGNERAVPDAVWAVSNAPADDTPATIAFESHTTIQMPRYGCLTPTIYAYNKYGDLVNINFDGYKLSCDAALGEVSADGKSVTITGEGCHALKATFGESTVSIPVEISGSIEGKILIKNTVIDNIHPFIVPCGADVNGTTVPVDGALLSWSTSDATVATVDESGTVRGVAAGTASITGKNGSYSGTVEVAVQPLTKEAEELDLTSSLWSLSKSGMNSATVSNDNGALKVNYNIKTARSANFTLKSEQALYSRPDILHIDFTAAEGAVKSIVISFKDNNGNTYSEELEYENSASSDVAEVPLLYSIKGAKSPARIANANPELEQIYPLQFVSVKFNVNGNANSGGTVRIQGIKTVYSDFGNTGINDVTPETANGSIEYFNLQGIKVNPEEMVSGIYIFRNGNKSGKIFIK